MAVYTANSISALTETTPDGSVEGVSTADDALREIKRAIRRMGICRMSTVTAAAPVGAVTDGVVKIDTTSNNVDYQLPAASTVQFAVVKWDSGANTAKISPAGSDTIDGSASELTFSTLGEVWILHSDGTTKWSKITNWVDDPTAQVMSVRQTKSAGVGNNYRSHTEYDLDDFGGSATHHYFINQLNTIEYNNITGASVENVIGTADTLRLPTGKYHLSGWSLCMAYAHRLMLTTGSSIFKLGTYVQNTTYSDVTRPSHIDCVFDVASGPQDFLLIHAYYQPGTYNGGIIIYTTFTDLVNTFCEFTIRRIAAT